VTFSESVTGVVAANFGLTTTGVAGATIHGVTGSGTTWTVTVDSWGDDRDVALNLVNSTGLKDADGRRGGGGEHALRGSRPTSIAPRVLSINRAGGPATSELFADFIVTFSETCDGSDGQSTSRWRRRWSRWTGSSTVTIGSINRNRCDEDGAADSAGRKGIGRAEHDHGDGGEGCRTTCRSANVPLTGQTVSVIAVRVTNTTTTTAADTAKDDPAMSARDNNIARLAETQADRMANGDTGLPDGDAGEHIGTKAGDVAEGADTGAIPGDTVALFPGRCARHSVGLLLRSWRLHGQKSAERSGDPEGSGNDDQCQ
jgi:hypothetical protein